MEKRITRSVGKSRRKAAERNAMWGRRTRSSVFPALASESSIKKINESDRSKNLKSLNIAADNLKQLQKSTQETKVLPAIEESYKRQTVLNALHPEDCESGVRKTCNKSKSIDVPTKKHKQVPKNSRDETKKSINAVKVKDNSYVESIIPIPNDRQTNEIEGSCQKTNLKTISSSLTVLNKYNSESKINNNLSAYGEVENTSSEYILIQDKTVKSNENVSFSSVIELEDDGIIVPESTNKPSKCNENAASSFVELENINDDIIVSVTSDNPPKSDKHISSRSVTESEDSNDDAILSDATDELLKSNEDVSSRSVIESEDSNVYDTVPNVIDELLMSNEIASTPLFVELEDVIVSDAPVKQPKSNESISFRPFVESKDDNIDIVSDAIDKLLKSNENVSASFVELKNISDDIIVSNTTDKPTKSNENVSSHSAVELEVDDVIVLDDTNKPLKCNENTAISSFVELEGINDDIVTDTIDKQLKSNTRILFRPFMGSKDINIVSDAIENLLKSKENVSTPFVELEDSNDDIIVLDAIEKSSKSNGKISFRPILESKGGNNGTESDAIGKLLNRNEIISVSSSAESEDSDVNIKVSDATSKSEKSKENISIFTAVKPEDTNNDVRPKESITTPKTALECDKRNEVLSKTLSILSLSNKKDADIVISEDANVPKKVYFDNINSSVRDAVLNVAGTSTTTVDYICLDDESSSQSFRVLNISDNECDSVTNKQSDSEVAESGRCVISVNNKAKINSCENIPAVKSNKKKDGGERPSQTTENVDIVVLSSDDDGENTTLLEDRIKQVYNAMETLHITEDADMLIDGAEKSKECIGGSSDNIGHFSEKIYKSNNSLLDSSIKNDIQNEFDGMSVDQEETLLLNENENCPYSDLNKIILNRIKPTEIGKDCELENISERKYKNNSLMILHKAVSDICRDFNKALNVDTTVKSQIDKFLEVFFQKSRDSIISAKDKKHVVEDLSVSNMNGQKYKIRGTGDSCNRSRENKSFSPVMKDACDFDSLRRDDGLTIEMEAWNTSVKEISDNRKTSNDIRGVNYNDTNYNKNIENNSHLKKDDAIEMTDEDTASNDIAASVDSQDGIKMSDGADGVIVASIANGIKPREVEITSDCECSTQVNSFESSDVQMSRKLDVSMLFRETVNFNTTPNVNTDTAKINDFDGNDVLLNEDCRKSPNSSGEKGLKLESEKRVDRKVVNDSNHDNTITQASAIIQDNTVIQANTVIQDRTIQENVVIQGGAVIKDNIVTQDSTAIEDNTDIHSNTVVQGGTDTQYSKIQKNTVLKRSADTRDNTVIQDSTIIQGNTTIPDSTVTQGSAIIQKKRVIQDNTVVEMENTVQNRLQLSISDTFAAELENRRGNFLNSTKVIQGLPGVSVEVLKKCSSSIAENSECTKNSPAKSLSTVSGGKTKYNLLSSKSLSISKRSTSKAAVKDRGRYASTAKALKLSYKNGSRNYRDSQMLDMNSSNLHVVNRICEDVQREMKEAKLKENEINWTVNVEVVFFYALIGHKPVGVNRHFMMLLIHNKFTTMINHQISSKILWDHLETMYDMAALHESEILPFPNEEVDFELPEDCHELLHSKHGVMLKKSNSENESTKSNTNSAKPSKKLAPKLKQSSTPVSTPKSNFVSPVPNKLPKSQTVVKSEVKTAASDATPKIKSETVSSSKTSKIKRSSSPFATKIVKSESLSVSTEDSSDSLSNKKGSKSERGSSPAVVKKPVKVESAAASNSSKKLSKSEFNINGSKVVKTETHESTAKKIKVDKDATKKTKVATSAEIPTKKVKVDVNGVKKKSDTESSSKKSSDSSSVKQIKSEVKSSTQSNKVFEPETSSGSRKSSPVVKVKNSDSSKKMKRPKTEESSKKSAPTPKRRRP